MNNQLGSFDHFSFTQELPETESESSSDVESNSEPPHSPPLKTTGPSIKKSILCNEEFVHMPKTLTSAVNLDTPPLVSDAPTKTSEPKPKKRIAKKNPATAARGKTRLANANSPKKAGAKKAPSRAPSQEDEVVNDKDLSHQLVRPQQPQSRSTTRRKRIPKKSNKREFLVELIELVDKYSSH